MVPSPAYDPFARCRRFGPSRNALLHIIERLAPYQVNVQLFKTAGAKVYMGIVKTGHHKMPAQIDYLRFWSFEFLYLVVRADRDDFSIRNCQSTGSSGKMGLFGRGGPHKTCVGCGIDIAIHKNYISRRLQLLRRRETSHCEHHQNSQKNFHSCTPVSANKTNRIRLSPRSRLLQSNHSRNVCAPPPSPPAPIVVASSPRASGTFASVEASRGKDSIRKCLSTART